MLIFNGSFHFQRCQVAGFKLVGIYPDANLSILKTARFRTADALNRLQTFYSDLST